jgi:hypothetical protein
MSDSRERLARNESLFREVNERIEDVAGENEAVEFVCECTDKECVSTLVLKLADYERIRSKSTWFFVKTGHNVAEVERVISEEAGYVIVEKLVGTEFSEEVDPRS